MKKRAWFVKAFNARPVGREGVFTMFQAIHQRQHKPRKWDYEWQVGKHQAEMESDAFWIRTTAEDDYVNLELTIKNRSDRHWPEIASIIPYFNPGKAAEVEQNDQLADPDHGRTVAIEAARDPFQQPISCTNR